MALVTGASPPRLISGFKGLPPPSVQAEKSLSRGLPLKPPLSSVAVTLTGWELSTRDRASSPAHVSQVLRRNGSAGQLRRPASAAAGGKAISHKADEDGIYLAASAYGSSNLNATCQPSAEAAEGATQPSPTLARPASAPAIAGRWFGNIRAKAARLPAQSGSRPLHFGLPPAFALTVDGNPRKLEKGPLALRRGLRCSMSPSKLRRQVFASRTTPMPWPLEHASCLGVAITGEGPASPKPGSSSGVSATSAFLIRSHMPLSVSQPVPEFPHLSLEPDVCPAPRLKLPAASQHRSLIQDRPGDRPAADAAAAAMGPSSSSWAKPKAAPNLASSAAPGLRLRSRGGEVLVTLAEASSEWKKREIWSRLHKVVLLPAGHTYQLLSDGKMLSGGNILSAYGLDPASPGGAEIEVGVIAIPEAILQSLTETTQQVRSLDPDDLKAVTSMNDVPDMVLFTFQAVLAALRTDLQVTPEDWSSMQAFLLQSVFDVKQGICDFEAVSVDPFDLFNTITPFVSDARFQPEQLGPDFGACTALCNWCISLHAYAAALESYEQP